MSDGIFNSRSRLGHKAESTFMTEVGLSVYTCVCNGWRVFAWKTVGTWNVEAHAFSPSTSLDTQFHRYPDLHDAEDAGLNVMRLPDTTEEVVMCALIYDLCSQPNLAGLKVYPPELITP